MWWFDIHIHYEMINTVKLVNIFITSHSYHILCVWWGHLRSTVSVNFKYTTRSYQLQLQFRTLDLLSLFILHNRKFVRFVQHLCISPASPVSGWGWYCSGLSAGLLTFWLSPIILNTHPDRSLTPQQFSPLSGTQKIKLPSYGVKYLTMCPC